MIGIRASGSGLHEATALTGTNVPRSRALPTLLTVEQTLAVADFAKQKLGEDPKADRRGILTAALAASGITIGEPAPLQATQQVVREGDLFRIQALPIYATTTRDMFGFEHDDLWMFEAASRAAISQNEGHLPPAHSEHHTHTGADRPRVGYLSRQTVGLGYEVDGVVRAVLFADVLVESEEAMRQVMARPYRSTETPIEDPNYVASLAFMESDAPHLKFPLPVYVGDLPDGAEGKIAAAAARYVTINASARAFAWFPQTSKRRAKMANAVNKAPMKHHEAEGESEPSGESEGAPMPEMDDQSGKLDKVLELLGKLAEKLLGEKDEEPSEKSPVEAPVVQSEALIAAKVETLKAQAETKKAMVEIERFNRAQTINAFIAKLKDENRAFDEAAVRAQCDDFVGHPKMWASYQATIEAAFPRAPGAGGAAKAAPITVDAKHPILGAFGSDPERYQKASEALCQDWVQAQIRQYPGNKESFARELVGQLLSA